MNAVMDAPVRNSATPRVTRSGSVRSVRARTGAGRQASARAATAHLVADDARSSAEGRVRPPLRWAVGAVGLGLVLLAALMLARVARDPVRYPVTNVDVLGTLDYTDRDALRAHLASETGRGFHGVDIERIRRDVERLPWVASAHVSRVWPGRISIDIEEHEPAARWNDDALLSKRLALFHPPQLAEANPRGAEWRELFSGLPRLTGANGRHFEVFEDRDRYAARLARFGVTPVALEEDARRSQTLELSNGVRVRLGYEDQARRLARFVDVYERLVAPLAGQTARFDMRYSNGFAMQGAGSLPATGPDATSREPG